MNLPAMWEIWVRSLDGEDPLSVSLPGEFHGERCLEGYNKELDTTEKITHFHTLFKFC